MKLQIESDILHDYAKASSREWIETNGLGGYSSDSLSGAHTRSYHGLFVVATHPPVGRTVLLSRLEENVLIQGKPHLLSCNQFPKFIYSEPLSYLQRFEKDPFPVFYYSVEGIEIKKTICFVHDEDVLAITYEVTRANQQFQMELKPFVAFRDFHSPGKANSAFNKDAVFGDNTLYIRPYPTQPPLYIYVEGSAFRYSQEWAYNFEYTTEQSRGLQFHEDLFQHGCFLLNLNSGSKVNIIISTMPPHEKNAFKLVETESERRETLYAGLPLKDSFSKLLALGADQFLVQRDNLKTIIAGYHWFSDWGRDTMIALPGLCLVTGRFGEAKKILKTFALSMDQGMIPNRFPDAGEVPEYNTVDATLWYFIAIYKYLEYSGDKNFVLDEMLPVLEEIIFWHKKGTRYNIHVASDGLIYSGQPGVQLTWMDAKVGNWVVTPRQGKAVEINALWYNALQIMSHLYHLKGDNARSGNYSEQAMDVKNIFLGTFINPDSESLYDCVDGDYKSTEVRPNQVFAISLPFPLLDQQTASRIIKIVEDKLLTPYGLRSLSPDDPSYIGFYGGDQLKRDGAYHQGTAWSWLLGPYISAKIKIEGEKGREFVREFLKVFERHFLEAGIGTVSEIFDGQPPYKPNGCIAQAWGVAEVLRAYIEDVCNVRPLHEVSAASEKKL